MKWRVKAGMRFGAFDGYGPGDTVELSEGEAAGFLDKLERVDGSQRVNCGLRIGQGDQVGVGDQSQGGQVEDSQGVQASVGDQAQVDQAGKGEQAVDGWLLDTKLGQVLARAGYRTVDDVRAASDQALLEVAGIGPGRLKAIREEVGSGGA